MTTLLWILPWFLALFPASMLLVNWWAYRSPREPKDAQARPAVSVLIPARNEEASIEAAVRSALNDPHPDLEVIVMDDQSTDRTASIVRALADHDQRVRLEQSPPLPDGWCGKQHACAALAAAARHPTLLFMDADVRLEPGGLARMLHFLETSGAGLVSGIPRQITGSWMERLVIPVIHFVLLGYLPVPGMRRSGNASFAAGCGQLMLARKQAYTDAGGHGAIRGSRHDGVTLPRAFRNAGQHTDLFDATDVARCRMYRNASEVWNGFAKNATEGMAGPVSIWVWTMLLFVGHVLPWLILAGALALGHGPTGHLAWIAGAAVLGIVTRLALALRFRQSIVGALLHPVGVAIVLAIQWYAWWLERRGRSVLWKGRVQLEG